MHPNKDQTTMMISDPLATKHDKKVEKYNSSDTNTICLYKIVLIKIEFVFIICCLYKIVLTTSEVSYLKLFTCLFLQEILPLMN